MVRKRKIISNSQINNTFHITVGVYPSGSLSLDRDLRLLKAALLYSDKVTLCSITSTLLINLLSLGELDTIGILDYMEFSVKSNNMIQYGIEPTDETLALIDDIRDRLSGRRYTRKELRPSLNELENQILAIWEPIRRKVEEMADEAGAEGLSSAVESGLVELKVLGIDEFNAEPLGEVVQSLEPLAAEFIVFLKNTILDANTYPLFDDQTGDLIKAGVDEGIIAVSDSVIARGKHSILASKLLERLPLFEDASIDEILDVRKELETPLVRFRRSIIEFSESLRTAAWDEEFPLEAEQVFHRDVAPAVLDIEEEVRSNRSLLSLLNRGLRKPAATGGIITVALSQLSALPELALYASLGGTVLATSSVLLSMINDYKEESKQLEQNQLYFYYRAGKLLQSQ